MYLPLRQDIYLMWSRKGTIPARFLAVISSLSHQHPSTLVVMGVDTKKIGNDVVSLIGFGHMALSAFYGAI